MASNWLRFVDLVLWVVVVSAALVGVLGALAFAFGDGLLTLKYALFVVGFLLFGLGSIALQPKRPHRDRKLISVDRDDEYGFEERIHELPPLRGHRLPLDARVSRNAKVFVVSLVVLAVSFGLEVGLDVSV